MVIRSTQGTRVSVPHPPPEMAGKARTVDQGGLFLLVLVLLVAGGAGTFMLVLPSLRPPHNMQQQPYHRPYTPTEAFADGMSERPLVSGTVPRPEKRSPGVPYVAVRVPGPANYPVVATSGSIPVPITRELLERGQQQYEIYCSMCHGSTGAGNGMIVSRGFYPPPSYHIQRLRDVPDAHFYNVITNGFGTMFSYAERVKPDDRWAITAYIRALQAAVERSPELSKALAKERGERR